MKTLSLDLSINCPGFCVSDGDQYIESGYQENDKRASVYSRIEANLRLINDLVTKHQIKQLWIEDIAGSPSMATGRMLSEQQGIIKYWARVRGIPAYAFPITGIKSFMTGKGDAKKPEMIAAVQTRGYSSVHQNDEADAISIWLYGLNQFAIYPVNQ